MVNVTQTASLLLRAIFEIVLHASGFSCGQMFNVVQTDRLAHVAVHVPVASVPQDARGDHGEDR